MIEALVAGAVGLLLLLVVGVGILLRRASRGPTEFAARLDHFEKAQERTERVTGDEIAKNREEAATQAKQQREEVGAALKAAYPTALPQGQ